MMISIPRSQSSHGPLLLLLLPLLLLLLLPPSTSFIHHHPIRARAPLRHLPLIALKTSIDPSPVEQPPRPPLPEIESEAVPPPSPLLEVDSGIERGSAEGQAATDINSTPPPSTPPPQPTTRAISRRDALLGSVGGALGVYLIGRSYDDIRKRDQDTMTYDKEASDRSKVEAMYPLPFITYLARFLIAFDDRTKKWWSTNVDGSLRPGASAGERKRMELKMFAEFSSSVEYGLRRYTDSVGRTRLTGKLMRRYGRDVQAREQMAILFSLLDDDKQPTSSIYSLLASLPPPRATPEALTEQDVLSNLLRAMSQDPLMLFPGSLMRPFFNPDTNRYRIPFLLQSEDQTRLDMAVSMANALGVKAMGVVVPTPFGPRALSPVTKERPLELATYGLFALSGAVGCAGTHAVVIPVDVVKTKKQTDPAGFQNLGISQSVQKIVKEEGPMGLVQGLEPTMLGYMYYGITVYPGYELFKRALMSAAGPLNSVSYHAPLVILAGALATFLACLGVCPAETIRIRMVATGSSFSSTVSSIVEKEGISTLYDGFPPLLVRQVLFGMMKFLVFDSFGNLVFDAFPSLHDAVWTSLLVSLLSGLVAGVASAIVSQPADTILSTMSRSDEGLSFTGAISTILNKYGPGGLFLGLGSRCLWSGSIISGQFLLYDVFRNLLHVSNSDLQTYMDAIASLQ